MHSCVNINKEDTVHSCVNINKKDTVLKCVNTNGAMAIVAILVRLIIINISSAVTVYILHSALR